MNMRSGCTSCWSWRASPAPTSSAVIIGTVVPRALHNLRGARRKYFGVDAAGRGRRRRWNGASSSTSPSRNRSAPTGRSTRSPRTRLHEGDLIVIDFGTATTFDVVDYSGAYKGGIIAPGINLSLDALVTAAAKLPRIAIEAPASNAR